MSYAMYVAGSDSPEAKKAKREYVAQRRQAGLESFSGYREPDIEITPGKAPTILLGRTGVAIMDELHRDGANTATIGRRIGVSAETVRRNLRVINSALGYTDRGELVAALAQGKIRYRAVR